VLRQSVHQLLITRRTLIHLQQNQPVPIHKRNANHIHRVAIAFEGNHTMDLLPGNNFLACPIPQPKTNSIARHNRSLGSSPSLQLSPPFPNPPQRTKHPHISNIHVESPCDRIATVTHTRRTFLASTSLLAAKPQPNSAFHGIYPIAQTPFRDDDTLDTETLKKQTAYLAKCGVHGLAWPQLASEFWSLTIEERLKGAETLLAAGKGSSIKIMIGVQSGNIDESIRMAKHAAKHGAHALISLPPEGTTLPAFFKQISAPAPGLPLCLQAVGKITVDEVIALSRDVPAVKIVKDEAGVTLPRITEFHTKAPQLTIFTGAHGRTMIDELLRGASGCMPAAGPADLYTRAYNQWRQNKHNEAVRTFARAAVLIPEFEQYGIEGLKYLLMLRGVFPNHKVRAPRNGDVGVLATKSKLDDQGKQALKTLWEGVSL